MSKLFYSQLFGVILMVLLLLLAVPKYMKSIPVKLSNNVQKGLHKSNIKWVSVRAEGRDMVLSGIAPSINEHNKVLSIAKETLGVRNIYDKISPQIITPYTMNIKFSKEEICLDGYVLTKKEKFKLFSMLKSKYPNKKLIDKIDIGAGNPKLWHGFLSKLLIEMQVLDFASVNIVDEKVNLAGKVKTEDQKEKLSLALQKFQKNPYEISNHIIAMDTPIKVCQKKFDALLREQKIEFASNKSLIKNKSNTLIKSLAYVASLCPQTYLEIGGHTDSLGNDQQNKILSLERAKAVVAKLFQEGVALERISAFGKGETLPIADNGTEEGRAKNRRIEFKVIMKEER